MVLINGDTLVAYNHKQNDFLVKMCKQAKNYKISDSICSLEVVNRNEVIKKDSAIIDNLNKVIEKDSLIYAVKENNHIDTENCLKSEIKRERLRKWKWIIIGAVVTSLETYYIIKTH